MSGVHLYSIGLCSASACAPADLAGEAIEESANAQHPTGIGSQWRISEDETFSGGEPHPCPCNTDPSRMHWLLNC